VAATIEARALLRLSFAPLRRRLRCKTVPMVLEHAVLNVISGEEQRFEGTFDRAKSIIGSMPGFRSLRLERCIETPSRYLLLVEWERIEDHTEGFRGSPQYEEFRRLIHHFYDPFPVFEHYEPLIKL
jgi:heme-degrading monooxygenase HmoA